MKTSYYLPPEWHEQAALLLTWPHNKGHAWTVPLSAVESVFIKIASLTSKYQQVIISCLDEEHQTHIQKLLTSAKANLAKIACYIVPNSDIWVRDHGPITVYDTSDNQAYLLDFEFNGWGNKFESVLDNQVTRLLVKAGAFDGYHHQSCPLVLEGGSIETDGNGSLLTTQSCLSNPNRNPILNKADLTLQLKHYFGVEHIIFLENGYLEGDDTDGHIDTLARFCSDNIICYVTCNNQNDPHFDRLHAMKHEIQSLRNCQGSYYHAVELPLPTAIYNSHGNRLPATYANFIITNEQVFVPVYSDSQDEIACSRLSACFSKKQIVPIQSNALITQSGSLHCATMQIPARKNLL